MTIEITKFPDFDRTADLIREAAKKELGIQLENSIREIDKRTKSGRDVDDRSFAPYSEAYIKDKVHRRKRSNTVNLEDTGEMLAAMTSEVRVENRGLVGIIKFATAYAAAKARGHMEGLGKSKVKRRFFELSEKQIQKITDGVRAAIREAMNR